MQSIKSFLWFSAKVALALVIAQVVNSLIAKFTGVDILGKIQELGDQVAS